MKKIQLSTDRILLIVTLLLLWYIHLVNACESETDIQLKPNLTIVNEESSSIKTYHSNVKRRRFYKK
ncbi:hypothetical protein KORDIASMS9_01107 [Kordia sp. SMS9]|uniref:hypothetical protein n=1 Tax=Kordia sp. SMS9 TaxID=2282170 RepID=UPI000E102A47|nr:hypothetical protein [Kordia sp. SMS9]AXG68889.1 hypothetical protein KORDIASMS9_01107 [Kordia sp. SMS9]